MELPRMCLTTKDAWCSRRSGNQALLTPTSAPFMEWHEDFLNDSDMLMTVESFFDDDTLRLLEDEVANSSTTMEASATLSGGQESGVQTTCSYRRGQCSNRRAVKRDGSLHTLCQFHRERSCLNQRRFDAKKRSSKKQKLMEMESISFMEEMAAVIDATKQQENDQPNAQADPKRHELVLSL